MLQKIEVFLSSAAAASKQQQARQATGTDQYKTELHMRPELTEWKLSFGKMSIQGEDGQARSNFKISHSKLN